MLRNLSLVIIPHENFHEQFPPGSCKIIIPLRFMCEILADLLFLIPQKALDDLNLSLPWLNT